LELEELVLDCDRSSEAKDDAQNGACCLHYDGSIQKAN
jgi:hypothetical protein